MLQLALGCMVNDERLLGYNMDRYLPQFTLPYVTGSTGTPMRKKHLDRAS